MELDSSSAIAFASVIGVVVVGGALAASITIRQLNAPARSNNAGFLPSNSVKERDIELSDISMEVKNVVLSLPPLPKLVALQADSGKNTNAGSGQQPNSSNPLPSNPAADASAAQTQPQQHGDAKNPDPAKTDETRKMSIQSQVGSTLASIAAATFAANQTITNAVTGASPFYAYNQFVAPRRQSLSSTNSHELTASSQVARDVAHAASIQLPQTAVTSDPPSHVLMQRRESLTRASGSPKAVAVNVLTDIEYAASIRLPESAITSSPPSLKRESIIKPATNSATNTFTSVFTQFFGSTATTQSDPPRAKPSVQINQDLARAASVKLPESTITSSLSRSPTQSNQPQIQFATNSVKPAVQINKDLERAASMKLPESTTRSSPPRSPTQSNQPQAPQRKQSADAPASSPTKHASDPILSGFQVFQTALASPFTSSAAQSKEATRSSPPPSPTQSNQPQIQFATNSVKPAVQINKDLERAALMKLPESTTRSSPPRSPTQSNQPQAPQRKQSADAPASSPTKHASDPILSSLQVFQTALASPFVPPNVSSKEISAPSPQTREPLSVKLNPDVALAASLKLPESTITSSPSIRSPAALNNPIEQTRGDRAASLNNAAQATMFSAFTQFFGAPAPSSSVTQARTQSEQPPNARQRPMVDTAGDLALAASFKLPESSITSSPSRSPTQSSQPQIQPATNSVKVATQPNTDLATAASIQLPASATSPGFPSSPSNQTEATSPLKPSQSRDRTTNPPQDDSILKPSGSASSLESHPASRTSEQRRNSHSELVMPIGTSAGLTLTPDVPSPKIQSLVVDAVYGHPEDFDLHVRTNT